MNNNTADRIEANIKRIEQQQTLQLKIQKAIENAERLGKMNVGETAAKWYWHADRLRELLT